MRRVEGFGDEITAEEAPVRAVKGSEDGDVVTVEDLVSDGGRGTVGDGSAVVSESLVGEGVAGDEDDTTRAEVEGEDGAVVDMEVVDECVER